jgi:hypothetical protein
MLMAKKICKGSHEWEDVAHFAIDKFIHHEHGQELVDAGRGMNFLSGIMWRSFNSSTSEYYALHRQKNRMHSLDTTHLEMPTDEYDYDQDYVVAAIQGIIEDMSCDKTDLWYRATLFQMWLNEPNFSELERRTEIPRNSISHAVNEAKKYIKAELKQQGIDYDI